MLDAARCTFEAQGTQTFTMSWLRLYAAMTSGIVLTCGPLLILVSVLSAGGKQILLDFGLPLFLSALLVELVFAVLLAGGHPVHIGAEGIQGFSFWGTRCKITWEEITSATPSRLLELPWLVVRSCVTKDALWLPLFTANPREFREAIARFAPQGCILLNINGVNAECLQAR